jgi:hypothetical protein
MLTAEAQPPGLLNCCYLLQTLKVACSEHGRQHCWEDMPAHRNALLPLNTTWFRIQQLNTASVLQWPGQTYHMFLHQSLGHVSSVTLQRHCWSCTGTICARTASAPACSLGLKRFHHDRACKVRSSSTQHAGSIWQQQVGQHSCAVKNRS